MDTKKKINIRLLLFFGAFTAITSTLAAQDVAEIELCGTDYSYSSDTITIYFNVKDINDQHVNNLSIGDLRNHLQIYEDGSLVKDGDFMPLKGGVRIPKDATISILIDKDIEKSGKEEIFEGLKDLIYSAPDSCVFLSFFDKETTRSEVVTKNNYDGFHDKFLENSNGKDFYGALYSKLLEFNQYSNSSFEPLLYLKAKENIDRATMFIFVDGSKRPLVESKIIFTDIVDAAKELDVLPVIYAFYYSSGSTLNSDVETKLKIISGRSTNDNGFKLGRYVSTKENKEIIKEVGDVIENQKCDFAYKYKVPEDKSYSGKTSFKVQWRKDGNVIIDSEEKVFAIGTPENKWPTHRVSATATGDILKYLIALLVTFLTIVIFFAVLKILVPFIKSKVFAAKYYKKYQPEYGIQKRICSYCKQPLEPGQMVVTKCQHIMHVHCWKENDYRCAEYGQNCNTGIQDYVDWKGLFSKTSFRDCRQVITGICTGAFSWIIYEIMKRKAFPGLSRGIASTFLTGDDSHVQQLLGTCSSKISSFLAIGMLLGFFLSFVFRWNEEYRKKNAAIVFKIIGLSLLSSLIGLLAFAFGGILLCMLIPASATSIPWYSAIPAYILFSVCESLSLTIKTSIPIKSAMLGGLCSAVIGFLVLYFTNGFSSRHPWMNMLLDFIIYGGGLGASLITVRMLAEKYFLVIQNGVKAGTRIPIHKWMNATGGGNKVTIGMTGDCEIQMNWEKSNKVAKEHVVLYVDHTKTIPVIKPLATNVIYNNRVELPVRKPAPLTNGDTFKIGDTIFLYEETD